MNEQPKRQHSKLDSPYVAFLVRCWREDGQWRIVLENVATRERCGFDNLVAFLEALEAQLDELP